MNNKVPLYSTGNYTEYLVITYMEQASEKLYSYISMKVKVLSCSVVRLTPPGSSVHGIL